MASATRQKARDSQIDLIDVSWSGFKRMLKVRGERRSPRIWYLDGRLTLVSPSMPHERSARRLGIFVMESSTGLEMPCTPIGATTLSRDDLNIAVEGDENFYLANADQMVGKMELDLNVDPPPDLAIEVIVTHSAKRAIEIDRRLGVPEVWVCSQSRLRFFRLGGDRASIETPISSAFPFLSSAEVFSWINQPHSVIESHWLLRLRAWVRDELVPRVRGEERREGE
ncbi:Uma2 family endonuclease [Tautonia rosea]|uniref:Uma2 family endonuclease n=1 Tax=Tautonia rosea TaxID=2728037 RepID=UPI0014741C08|nr:Uma2 family endonuclease [Tautonia rosea]